MARTQGLALETMPPRKQAGKAIQLWFWIRLLI
jgi:hypothetical protein